MRLRRTKVVATIGPASDDAETLEGMIRAGMNVARLNFSHGTQEEHRRRIDAIRYAAQRAQTEIAIMGDTRGLEIRTGRLQGGAAVLTPGTRFLLYLDERLGNSEGVSVTHDRLSEEVSLGDRILLDDGRIELEVVALSREAVECRVDCGGTLRDRKGVNLPEKELSLDVVGSKNRSDLVFAAENDIDYLAASFVRTADDVNEIRSFLEQQSADIPVVAKIESRAGVEHLEAIVEAADGTMVARGDLGVELPMAQVPTIQKRVIRTTVTSGKPVITATQMLDSMERNPRPTRAEVSDVANAILDGTSAVMLSGETAVGRYPVEAVETMASLALQAEASLPEYGYLQKIRSHPAEVVTEAVSQAAITMAHHLKAAAIVCLTESGRTSRMISKYRPDCPILAVTGSSKVVRRLSMNWGVFPFLLEGEAEDREKVLYGIEEARERGYVASGDVVVATGATLPGGSTDMIRVVTVADGVGSERRG